MAKEKPELFPGFKNVSLEGDCGIFTLKYTPTCKGGKPQEYRLDADEETDARFEAAALMYDGTTADQYAEKFEVLWS